MSFLIETNQLLVREWKTDDFEPFRNITTDPIMMRYISNGVPWTDAKIHDFFDRQAQHVSQHGFCLGALNFKSDPIPIGLAGLQYLSTTSEVEIGWWVSRNLWYQGLGTEIGQGLIEFAFSRLKLPEVVAIAHPNNHASIRIMEKLGMTFDCHTSAKELSLKYPDVEIVLYRLLNKLNTR